MTCSRWQEFERTLLPELIDLSRALAGFVSATTSWAAGGPNSAAPMSSADADLEKQENCLRGPEGTLYLSANETNGFSAGCKRPLYPAKRFPRELER